MKRKPPKSSNHSFPTIMMVTEGSLSTPTASTLDGNALTGLRQAITDFIQRCGLKYDGTVPDDALYTECCEEAINRGFPMEGKHSIRPYMASGVAMMAFTYAHLPDRATKMWICLFSAAISGIDNLIDDIEHVYAFNERFASCQPQGDPALQACDTLLREIPHLYSPVVSNLIITSSLDYITSILIEHETKDMQISAQTPLYPDYYRLLSGMPTGYVLFIFPSTIPIPEYIQSMPDLNNIINYVNDILSFYKEEIEGDNINTVSLSAASHGITKLDALHEIIDKTVQSHHNILKSLKPHSEAYNAYVSFVQGYVRFFAVVPRYKLQALMGEVVLQ